MSDMQAETGAPLTSRAGDAARDATKVRPRRRSLFLVVVAIAAGWLAVDQITKNLAEKHLGDGATVPFIGELLQFHLTYNPGAAFSMGTGSTALLTVLAATVCTVIIWNARRLGSVGWAIGLGLLLGGALGNLTDRLTREPGFGKGHVVDFLMLPNFPIFNVADIGITSAAVLIGLLALRGINPDGTRGDGSEEQDVAASPNSSAAQGESDASDEGTVNPAGTAEESTEPEATDGTTDLGAVGENASSRHTDESSAT